MITIFNHIKLGQNYLKIRPKENLTTLIQEKASLFAKEKQTTLRI